MSEMSSVFLFFLKILILNLFTLQKKCIWKQSEIYLNYA